MANAAKAQVTEAQIAKTSTAHVDTFAQDHLPPQAAGEAKSPDGPARIVRARSASGVSCRCLRLRSGG